MCLAVPGRILDIDGDDPLLRTGRVDFAGIVKTVSLAYVPEANVGDYVLVHVGFAIGTVDEKEAAETFEYLRQMGDLAELDPAPGDPGAPPGRGPADGGTPPAL
jgi:hydrogenase expression/formation protein HypC